MSHDIVPGTLGLVPVDSHAAWKPTHLSLEGEDRLRVDLVGPSDGDRVQVEFDASGATQRAFRHYEHGVVRYRGKVETRTESVRQSLIVAIGAIGEQVDGICAASPDTSLAQAVGGGPAEGPVRFDRAGLASLLAPNFALDAPAWGGWVWVDLYPSSYRARTLGDAMEFVLEFRQEGRPALMVTVSPPSVERAFVRTPNFAVNYLDPPQGADADAPLLASLVGLVLGRRDFEELEVTVTTAGDDVGVVLLDAPPEEAVSSRALNLAVDADCGQNCSFCSIRDRYPAAEAKEGALASYETALAAARREGGYKVRLNGYDPLAWSGIVDLLRRVTAMGFTWVELHSPAVRLADRAFAEAVVGALPARRQINVPIYGPDAATHDAVVGVPGHFDRLGAALKNLGELTAVRDLQLITVITRANLPRLGDLAAWAEERGLRWISHLPYPSFESRTDAFFTAAAPEADIAEALIAALADDRAGRLLHRGVKPCLLLRAGAERGVAVDRWLVPAAAAGDAATEYADEDAYLHGTPDAESAFAAATVPCPHVAECALSPSCSRAQLRAYVELYGIDELRPVSVTELLAAP